MKQNYIMPQTAVHKIEQSLPIAVSNPSVGIGTGTVDAANVESKYRGEWDIWSTKTVGF